MANNHINYAEKIIVILNELPDCVSDFIYNYGHASQTNTMYEYAKDIQDFFNFVINYLPEFCDKQAKELTLDDITKIEPIDINRYLTVLSSGENKLKETTVKRRRATLSSLFSFLVNNNKLPRNPVLATKPIKVPQKELVYLTDDEQLLLLETVRTGTNLSKNAATYHNRYEARDSAMFLLLLDTGLRASEMLNTDIADYDLEECSVLVTRKGGDIQKVYFSDECANYLETYFVSQRAKFRVSDYDIPAFTTLQGERLGIRATENLVKKYVRACLPEKAKTVSIHKLRSSFAMSFLAASSNDIMLLKRKMNHRSLSTTQVYLTASDDAMRESRSILERKRKDK